ncbi:hypothetical protein MKX01_006551, partial [Papaver californicum]
LNGVLINEEDSTIFDPDVAKGLAKGCLLPKNRKSYAQIIDQADMLGIYSMNTFHILFSFDRANQMLKSYIPERGWMIRDALANMDLEIARIRSELSLKDLEIDALRIDMEEYH